MPVTTRAKNKNTHPGQVVLELEKEEREEHCSPRKPKAQPKGRKKNPDEHQLRRVAELEEAEVQDYAEVATTTPAGPVRVRVGKVTQAPGGTTFTKVVQTTPMGGSQDNTNGQSSGMSADVEEEDTVPRTPQKQKGRVRNALEVMKDHLHRIEARHPTINGCGGIKRSRHYDASVSHLCLS